MRRWLRTQFQKQITINSAQPWGIIIMNSAAHLTISRQPQTIMSISNGASIASYSYCWLRVTQWLHYQHLMMISSGWRAQAGLPGWITDDANFLQNGCTFDFFFLHKLFDNLIEHTVFVQLQWSVFRLMQDSSSILQKGAPHDWILSQCYKALTHF